MSEFNPDRDHTPPSDGYGSEDEKFIPLADYEHMKQQFFEERERKLRALDERDQLREALNKVDAGIHKASEEPLPINGNVNLRVDTWRHCREMAMNLLHVSVGNDDVELILELKNGYLLNIGQKKANE